MDILSLVSPWLINILPNTNESTTLAKSKKTRTKQGLNVISYLRDAITKLLGLV